MKMKNNILALLVLMIFSCNDTSTSSNGAAADNGLTQLTKISNVDSIYTIVDEISKSKFTKDNFDNMGLLYKNKKVIDIIDKNAYSGLSDYFIVLFLKNPDTFYLHLSECEDADIQKKISQEISMHIEIATGEGGQPNYKDSLYNLQITKYKSHSDLVNYIFNY